MLNQGILSQLDIYEKWQEKDEKQETEILKSLNEDDLCQVLANRIKRIQSDPVRGTVRDAVEGLVLATQNHGVRIAFFCVFARKR